MPVFRLMIGIGLFVCLLNVGLVGCGVGRPPVQSLEQWERDYNRTLSRGGD